MKKRTIFISTFKIFACLLLVTLGLFYFNMFTPFRWVILTLLTIFLSLDVVLDEIYHEGVMDTYNKLWEQKSKENK